MGWLHFRFTPASLGLAGWYSVRMSYLCRREQANALHITAIEAGRRLVRSSACVCYWLGSEVPGAS